MNSFIMELPETVVTALATICGHYGNGEERKELLTSDGYDYNTVQSCVNDLLGVINKYGS